MLWTVLLVVLILVLVGGGWPGHGPLHTHYGYYPVGLGGLLLVVLIVLLLVGRI